jgi:hypothetical protein
VNPVQALLPDTEPAKEEDGGDKERIKKGKPNPVGRVLLRKHFPELISVLLRQKGVVQIADREGRRNVRVPLIFLLVSHLADA